LEARGPECNDMGPGGARGGHAAGGAALASAVPLVVDRLAPADVAQLRRVCRAWRGAADKSVTRLVAFAPPPLPTGGAAASDGGDRADGGGGPGSLAGGARALACVPPLRAALAPGRARGGRPAGGAWRAAGPRDGWVRALVLRLPGLGSLELACGVPGWDDLERLRELPALRHATLLDFPFEGPPPGAAASPAAGVAGGDWLARTVGVCSALRTLCLQSDAVSGARARRALVPVPAGPARVEGCGAAPPLPCAHAAPCRTGAPPPPRCSTSATRRGCPR
jgi:hypothetical protein